MIIKSLGSSIDIGCEAYVYKCFNDGVVFYVGSTTSPVARMKYHKFDIEIEEMEFIPTTKSEMLNLEADTIVSFKPAYNKILPKNSNYIRKTDLENLYPDDFLSWGFGNSTIKPCMQLQRAKAESPCVYFRVDDIKRLWREYISL